MIQIRRSDERGRADHGWLKSRHTFSFADYQDAGFMGYRALRVINEDRIDGGTGFGAHSHRDMEIISYVVTGLLKHQDSLGNDAVIRPGDVQRMSAGLGVTHAEMNGEAKTETHFFQIWIIPRAKGDPPGYGQKSFEDQLAAGGLVLVVSNDRREGSIGINQDADLYLARLSGGDGVEFNSRPGRGQWLHVIRGRVVLNGRTLDAGDAAVIEDEALRIEGAPEAGGETEIMLFDLA